MADLGATFTDAEIAKTEKELKAVYNKAYKDILQKQKDFNEKYKIKEEKKLKQVASGQITQEEFDHWKKGQVFQGKQWENKKKQILGTIYKTNEVATGIVNGKTHNVFAFNANYTAYDLEHGAGVNFGFELYDEATVVNLIKNDPQLLPKWKIDQPKDYTWNQKKLNRQINLGIIEGESLDKIANRLGNALVTQNFNKMRTFARTAMTGAQNSGRQIRLEEAKGLGIKLKKEWMATLDTHTRINHRELDGQKVDTDKEFEVDGMKIRYPGDPQAHPSMVYNCRCTMVGDLENYPATYDRYDNIDGKRIKGMTYKEWEEAKKKGDDISPIPLTYSKKNIKKDTFNVVDGKNISETWVRRSDQFDFEIEDVINAQGFDGLPKVVSAEEFEEAVKAANGGNGFIAQRTYSAPDRETLDAYRDQLYHGKWYVDCSTGGAQYGQGMYCAADYSGQLTDGIKEEMRHYGQIGRNRCGGSALTEAIGRLKIEAIYDENGDLIPRDQAKAIRDMTPSEFVEKFSNRFPELKDLHDAVSYTETFTLDPSAKIISYDDIFQMKVSYPEKIRDQYKNAYLEEHASILGEDGIEFAKRNFGIDGYEFDWKRMNELYGNMSDEAKQIANAVSQISAPDEEVFKYNSMDLGAFAVLNGYDAINAVGHGASSSYTVILNRTKVIFKGD